MSDLKRGRGQYFTVKNPFDTDIFKIWAMKAGLPNKRILEPFAGANHIIESLQSLGLCDEYVSYDISPAHKDVEFRDTIEAFPTEFNVCVSNPPWLARNSATRRGLPYPTDRYDNLYKLCLELCLTYCEYVAVLLPASFLQSELFRDRLNSYILLHDLIFDETENPVCLVLFSAKKSREVNIYCDDQFIGALDELEKKMPSSEKKRNVKFNDPAGQLGFISFDNTRERSIRFCDVNEIQDYEIKASSRFITRISGDFENVSKLIAELNDMIRIFRDETSDILLTPFKGMRDDGKYRRRMFFSQARKFIDAA